MSGKRDPHRLTRYVAIGAIDGVLAGWAFCAGLLAFAVYGLWSRAASQADGPLITLIFFLLTGITFGMVGIAWRVMVLLPGERE